MLTYSQCFDQLTLDKKLGTQTIVFIKHANVKDAYRVFSTYTNPENTELKRTLGSLLNMTLDPTWHWHHIIEKTHLNPLFSSAASALLYETVIPCVLIDSKTEHYDYNVLLHTAATEAVFELGDRSYPLSEKARVDYLSKMRNLYSKTYSHDEVLHTVAMNVMNWL